MMKIYLIRHSMTEGNRWKRYIGTTDEELCEEGIELLKGKEYPEAQRIYTSPMKRCRQTAQMIYPGQPSLVIKELAECDFGLFENKNYQELSGCVQYQEWIDSNGTLPFPKGESRETFIKRSLQGFQRAIEQCRESGLHTVAFVVHGGTIMSIMEQYAYPQGGYYDYQVGNGEGYELILEDDDSGDDWIRAGSASGRSEVDVSSGTADRTPDYRNGKNYKKLFPEV